MPPIRAEDDDTRDHPDGASCHAPAGDSTQLSQGPGLPARSPDAVDPEELVRRMRAGDRDAAAEFIRRYDSRIRRRIRGKLGPAMRRLFDSQDIVSTLGRRLDLYVRSRRLQAVSGDQLWSLVMKMAEHAVIDKSRIAKRLQSVEAEDAPFAQIFMERVRRAESFGDEGSEIEIARLRESLPDETDREILSLWLGGMSHVQTAEMVGLAPTAVRKRWQSIKAHLRDQIEAAETA